MVKPPCLVKLLSPDILHLSTLVQPLDNASNNLMQYQKKINVDKS